MMSTIESVLQYIGIMVVVLIVLSIFIVKYYAEPGFPVHTSITVVICYFCAFGILLIIPPDIASAVVERNRTTSLDDYYDNIQFLSVFYNTLFVTILVMGSVVLVFQEYYNTDGTSLTSSSITQHPPICQPFHYTKANIASPFKPDFFTLSLMEFFVAMTVIENHMCSVYHFLLRMVPLTRTYHM